jgi:surface polysaccharide O-acyltransferase-like enzyme
MDVSQFVLEYLFVIISLIILLAVPRYARVFWVTNIDFPSKGKNRLQSIDAMRGLSIIGVIIIHTCYLLLYKYNGIAEIITLNSINNIFRFAIPVFLFTSGLLLKNFIWQKSYIFNFYFSKFLRIGVPYIIINIILWQIGYNTSAPLWQMILVGSTAVPFYFIPILFQLYLLYPILDYIRNISPRYLLIISFGISIFSFFMYNTWYIGDFPLFTQYLIFFVYGMVRKDILDSKISNIWRELIFIYIILQFIFIIPMISNNIDIDILRLMLFYNFQPILGFGFIFTMFKYFESNQLGSQSIKKFFSPIGKFSLWIFLLHFPIQQFLFNNIQNIDIGIILAFIHNFGLTLIISLYLAFIINKIYNITQYIKI